MPKIRYAFREREREGERDRDRERERDIRERDQGGGVLDSTCTNGLKDVSWYGHTLGP